MGKPKKSGEESKAGDSSLTKPVRKFERVACETCGRMIQRRNIRRHRREVHQGPVSYKCTEDGCQYSSKRMDDVTRHELLVHRLGGEASPAAAVKVETLPKVPKLTVKVNGSKSQSNSSATVSVPPEREGRVQVVTAEIHPRSTRSLPLWCPSLLLSRPASHPWMLHQCRTWLLCPCRAWSLSK